VFGWALLIGVGLFVVGVVIRLVIAFKPRGEQAAPSRQRLREAMDSGEALAAASPEWLAEADQLTEEADLRRSFRALYLALLSGLHRAERIDFRRNRTNWTYVRQFRGEGDQRQRLSQLTEQFDAIWYGRQSPEQASMQRAKQQVRTLLGEDVAPATGGAAAGRDDRAEREGSDHG
jgi:hypothetical protein